MSPIFFYVAMSSPIFFNVYSEDSMREALERFEGGVRFGRRRITNPRYADDTTLICSCKEKLLNLLNWVMKTAEKRRIFSSPQHTHKIIVFSNMVVYRDRAADDEFLLDGQKTKEVLQF